MLTELLYTIISTIHFIFSTPWLGMFLIPLLGFIAFKFVSNYKRDTLQKLSSKRVKPYVVFVQIILFTFMLYLFIFLGSLSLKESLFQQMGRNELIDLLETSRNSENIYLNAKLLNPSSQLIDDLLKVESRSQHRVKGGRVSSPLDKKSTLWIGRHKIELYQDNGIEHEYWVYFDNYGHIGQIDTIVPLN